MAIYGKCPRCGEEAWRTDGGKCCEYCRADYIKELEKALW